MAFNVERGLISKLLETKDILTVKDSQIKLSYFTGYDKSAFSFIQDTVLKTGEVPTVRAFQRKFPTYELEVIEIGGEETVGTEENLKYWCEELRTKVKHNTLAEAVGRVANDLQSFRTEEAFSALKKEISFIENEVTETSDVDLTEDTESRVEAYLERKKNKGMRGIPTGFKHLDYILKGLENETLTTLIAQTGVGKANTLDTPILTPEGFKYMRNIQVGDKVIGEDGKAYSVSAVYPQGELDVYLVTFEDGTTVKCSKEHLWKFKTIDDVSRGNEWRVKTLEDIINDHPIKRGKSFNLSVPVNKPVEFYKKYLIVDPYVIGCLLGDGGFTTDRISFTSVEEDVVSKLNDKLKHWGEFTCSPNKIQYTFKGIDPRENKLFRSINQLGLNDVKSQDKFIPFEYLHSDIEDRRNLLAGLIDTDGHINSKGATSFSTSSLKLMKDFMYLCRSLGYRCYSSTYDRGDKGIDYVVRIATKDELFSSEKHRERYNNRRVSKRHNYYGHLKIVDIQLLDIKEEMQCISVDSEDHTYICSDFIVTHNTWFEILLGAYCQLNNYRVLQFVTEMSEEIMRDRYESILFSRCYGGINYNEFKSGTLSSKIEEQYFKFLREDLPHFEPLIIATATGVMGVSASIEKYDPDIVLIDSAYLMEDDQGAKDDWLRVAHITRDLKKLAKRSKKPIFINTQADKNTSKKTGPELGSIMYTQAIGQDSDNVLALFRDEVMFNDREMGIKVLKQREGTLGKVTLNWDFDTMNFDEIYLEREDTSLTDNTLDIL